MNQTVTTSRQAAALKRNAARAAMCDHDHDLQNSHDHLDRDGDESGSGSIPISNSLSDHDHDTAAKHREWERTSVLGIVKHDRYFNHAIEVWGTARGTLIKAIELLGVQSARDCVKRVQEMPDWRFERGWRNREMPQRQRRGAYLMNVFRNQAMIVDRPWSTWRAAANG